MEIEILGTNKKYPQISIQTLWEVLSEQPEIPVVDVTGKQVGILSEITIKEESLHGILQISDQELQKYLKLMDKNQMRPVVGLNYTAKISGDTSEVINIHNVAIISYKLQ